MEQDQNGNSNERIEATIIQRRAISSQNDSVVGDTHHPKNQKNHDRAQSTQGRTELEHVPSHRSSRSMHTRTKKTKSTIRNTNSTFFFCFPWFCFSFFCDFQKQKAAIYTQSLSWKFGMCIFQKNRTTNFKVAKKKIYIYIYIYLRLSQPLLYLFFFFVWVNESKGLWRLLGGFENWNPWVL